MAGFLGKIQSGKMQLPPIGLALGCTILRVAEDNSELECGYEIGSQFLNPAGQVQGGILCAMLDDATSLLVVNAIEEGAGIATLNLNTSFIRPSSAGAFQAVSRLVRKGNEICNVTGELRQNGKLIATATAVSKILPATARG